MKIKSIIAGLALLSLSGCATMVSTQLLPFDDLKETGKARVDPPTNEFALDSALDVHNVCSRIIYGSGLLTAALGAWIQACSFPQYDPDDDCVIIYHKGDERRRQHEKKHCEGYADTYLPWKALEY